MDNPMQPVTSKSGWVISCGWHNGELYVQFQGALCIYSDPTGRLYQGLLNAPSAGSFVHAYLYHLPYRTG